MQIRVVLWDVCWTEYPGSSGAAGVPQGLGVTLFGLSTLPPLKAMEDYREHCGRGSCLLSFCLLEFGIGEKFVVIQLLSVQLCNPTGQTHMYVSLGIEWWRQPTLHRLHAPARSVRLAE